MRSGAKVKTILVYILSKNAVFFEQLVYIILFLNCFKWNIIHIKNYNN